MHSLKEDYLKKITFSADELTLLKTIGSYQGRQAAIISRKNFPRCLRKPAPIFFFLNANIANLQYETIAIHERAGIFFF